MKLRNILTAMLAALAITATSGQALAADAPVKREMRSAWVATVWQLDWPSTTVTETGNELQISQQKAQMTALLDSIAANNMNAINFQVRSRCDAMYKSSYEPWSTDLVGERGMDPGWDPLEWVVAECHKRGLECHAWVNPYRYESVSNQWDGSPKCYRQSNPEWMLDVNGATILNPGIPEVTEQIVKVIREIVQNYDIDGVLFDDYFYLSGTPKDSSGDGDLYSAYTAAGGKLSHNDWRRDNVNKMVAAVYNMIQEEKPWVRFGISPAGVSCTTSSHAAKYGITQCPTGSDWQYNSIFSDPIAWIANQTLDYISPQIYWTVGHSSNDYSKIAPWWGQIAAKYNRHFYSSHDIASLTKNDGGFTPQSMSLREQSISETLQPKASGPNSTSYEEYANQVRINRSTSPNNAPGSIFYSCKYLYKNSPLFAHYLKNTVFNTPALVPAMTFKPGYNPGSISEFTRDGDKLQWKGFDNVRYTVYAVPTSLPIINFNCEPEYLLGTTYEPSYIIPEDLLSGHTYAVCVLDRYGNEYSPIFIGQPVQSMPAPALTFPADNATVEAPFEFQWDAVENASAYILEVASDKDFKKLLYTRLCHTNSCATTELEHVPVDTKLYWRVRSCGNGYSDGISQVRGVTPLILSIVYPAHGATDVELAPEVTWNFTKNDREVKMQIATSPTFEANSIVHTSWTFKISAKVPACKLGAYTTYYARLSYWRENEQIFSDVITFTTKAMTPKTPTILFPVDGGEFRSEDIVKATPTEGIYKVTIEVNNSSSFNRNRYFEDCAPGAWQVSVKSGEMRVANKLLAQGTVYYMRVVGTYNTPDGSTKTDYSPVISATYCGEGTSVENIDSDDNTVKIVDGNLVITNNDCSNVTVKAINAAGAELGTLFDGNIDGTQTISLSTLGKGLFVIIIDTADGRKTVKASL